MSLFSSSINFGIIFLSLSVLAVDSAAAQGTTNPATAELAPSQLMAMQPNAVYGAQNNQALGTAIADNLFTSLGRSCFEGVCVETFYTDPSLEAAADNESLYALTMMTEFSFERTMQESEWDIDENPTQVLCSTTRPMVIKLFSISDPYTIHHISGGSPNSYSSMSLQEPDALYWDVCHGLKNPSVNDVRQQAGQLGYDLNRESRKVEQTFLELIEK